jgi:hypothetical protein
MLHGGVRQDRDMGDVALGAIRVRDRRLARNRAEMGNLRRREHERDARNGARSLDIGDAEPGMGVRAAQHDSVQGALGRVVVGVAAAARDQALILDPPHRLANSKLAYGHGSLSVRR